MASSVKLDMRVEIKFANQKSNPGYSSSWRSGDEVCSCSHVTCWLVSSSGEIHGSIGEGWFLAWAPSQDQLSFVSLLHASQAIQSSHNHISHITFTNPSIHPSLSNQTPPNTSLNPPQQTNKNKNKPTNPPPPPPSQGAQIVHLSTALLGTFPQISAVVLFGDPDEGKAISCLTPAANSADVLTICHDGDLICDGQPIVLPAHLTYGLDGIKAAGFVAGRVFV